MREENELIDVGKCEVSNKGYHVILDLIGVPENVCDDDAFLLDSISSAALQAGCTVINSCRYHFGHNSEPGCTVFVMLDESHISAHTYSSMGLVAIDVFTCGHNSRYRSSFVKDAMLEAIPHKQVKEYELARFDHLEVF